MKRTFRLGQICVGVIAIPSLISLSTLLTSITFKFCLLEPYRFLNIIGSIAFLSVFTILSRPLPLDVGVPLKGAVCVSLMLPRELDESFAPYYTRAGLGRNEFYFDLVMHAIEVGLPPSVDKSLVTIIIPRVTDEYFTDYCMSTGQDKVDFYSKALIYALQVWFEQREILHLKYIS